MSSDNIDYAELDRAVNEAMRAQPKSSSSRSTATKAKPAAVAPRPAPRPQNHGRIMDFAPRNIHSHTQVRPAQTTTATARPIVKRPAIQQRPTTSTVPQRSVVRPTTRVATIRKATPAPTSNPAPRTTASAEKPAMSAASTRPSVAAKIQQKQQRAATPVPQVPARTKAPKEAPDANSYSLGGRSPFLADTKVEKRPLGNNIPENSATSIQSTKNIYSQKNPAKAPVAKRKKHTVTEAPKSHSGWLWSLIVILVIAAGAGLGYVAYLIVFANQL